MNFRIELKSVEFIPKVLNERILFVSKRFNVAAHLCPCGCGTKVVTPLGPCEWFLSVKKGKPTLFPSIGNWQIPCRSHYWIKKGQIEWSYSWTEEEIRKGRDLEQKRREAYYNSLMFRRKTSRLRQLLRWVKSRL